MKHATSTYLFHGWTGSGVCRICGLLTTGPLGMWQERTAITGLYSARVPAVRDFFACVPCGASVAALPPGVSVLVEVA